MIDTDPSEFKTFFPRQRKFWIYNSVGWGGVLAFFLLAALVDSGDGEQEFSGKLLLSYAGLGAAFFYFSGTLSGLIFRRWYHQKRWYESTFQEILPRAILLAWLSSVIISGILLIFMAVTNAGEIQRMIDEGGYLLLLASLLGVSGNGIFVFVLITLWCSMYLGIKGTQNSRTFSLRALSLENSLKEAKLNVLSGQINPHFLFNALNNIRYLMHEDTQRADASLISVAEILRYSLDSTKRDKVSLSVELAIVRRYLELMKNQMEQRLNYSISCEQSLDALLVPPMVIQMLAENAIKHGIDKIQLGGDISIECTGMKTTQGEDRLVITVSNTMADGDSVGRNNLPSSALDSNESGVGLDNISKRLKLLYEGRAKLSLNEQKPTMVVTIEVPAQPA